MIKIEINKIMNTIFLFGIVVNIIYWYKKYHSDTICKGINNPHASNTLSGYEKEEKSK